LPRIGAIRKKPPYSLSISGLARTHLANEHTWLKTGGNEPGESTPHDVVALAQRHPDVQFVCVLTGGDWERGIRIISDKKNVSAEIAGSNPTSGLVEMAVRELRAKRVIYWSDVGGRSFASRLGKVLGADIPDSAKELILGRKPAPAADARAACEGISGVTATGASCLVVTTASLNDTLPFSGFA